ncbi:MAG: hypothetical protein IKU81_03560 [Oscillibacter sp.]|nr:hypothetical protein [Oscillibacter sp.]
MLNEWKEFQAYTKPVDYTAVSKRDTTYMGRFTFDTLMDFEGLSRVLTILTRGYLFHTEDGSLVASPRENIDHARRALCAWCSIPDSKKATPKEAWQFQSDFRALHSEFPELVDEHGGGWFYRHVHNIADFVFAHLDVTSKSAQDKCLLIQKGFDAAWRKKVIQFQTPIFSPGTKGQWIMRFDDAIADALELGPLRQDEVSLSPELENRIGRITPKGMPPEVIPTLICYYKANKPEDSDWVVLPVANFDAFFGNTSFGRKHLKMIPQEIMERSDSGYGVCRYRVRKEYLMP